MLPKRNGTFLCRRHDGFTLLEAVVVVAIIAVVGAIVLPILAQVRRQAVRVQCVASLRKVGVAAAAYSVEHRFRLPTHHAETDISFDTFQMCLADGNSVNLGLLVDYVDGESTFYCPAQPADHSPDIAYDSPHNRWRWRHGGQQGQSPGSSPGPGGPGGPGGSGPGPPASTAPAEPPGPNASYATRCRSQNGPAAVAWTLLNYSNKVIYGDFVGVDDWPGRGRLPHGLRAPHDGQGYNRLFGDGSVLWAASGRINALRPVGPTEPALDELLEYYELLDILP